LKLYLKRWWRKREESREEAEFLEFLEKDARLWISHPRGKEAFLQGAFTNLGTWQVALRTFLSQKNALSAQD